MRTFACLALLLLPACSMAHGPRSGAESASTSLEASPQQVLAELPLIYRELGLPIAAIQEANLEIRSGNFAAPTMARHQFESQDYRCGMAMRTIRGTSVVEYAVMSTALRFDDVGGVTRVESRLVAERVATFPDGSSERQTCLSTGRLERLIQQMLVRRLQLG
jgi:hypothetical protein